MHYTMIYIRKLTHSMFYLKLQNVAYQLQRKDVLFRSNFYKFCYLLLPVFESIKTKQGANT